MNNSVKKTVKTLSQTALAVTLLMGNITAPTEQGYYEDDAGFNQVSVNMESGWGWGFNQAQAANTGCWDTTEWEPMPCGSQDSSSGESSSEDSSYAHNDVEDAPQAVINFTEQSLLVSVPSYNIDSAKVTTLGYASVESAKQSSLLQGLSFSTNNLLAGRRA
ncbi:hypothetical protein [Thalassomonas haliotis]|uniref:Uncharacterized protein n=1 Tax=Thalassomonas haliotis TaxID=485448 RepID=A0ABY7VEG5_9GAMM|nr:hypothetical protein [Thalassomonas haliotis]WDE11288.1 hypothetical protein H3N35_24205 [Thalassomonas haliotis]